jgi:hypothetical protein
LSELEGDDLPGVDPGKRGHLVEQGRELLAIGWRQDVRPDGELAELDDGPAHFDDIPAQSLGVAGLPALAAHTLEARYPQERLFCGNSRKNLKNPVNTCALCFPPVALRIVPDEPGDPTRYDSSNKRAVRLPKRYLPRFIRRALLEPPATVVRMADTLERQVGPRHFSGRRSLCRILPRHGSSST